MLTRLATRHPVGSALASVIVTLAVMGVGVAVAAAGFGLDPGTETAQVVGQVVGLLFLLGVLWRGGWLASAGVTRLGDRRLWRTTLVILVWTCGCALVGFFGTLAADLSVDAAMTPTLVQAGLAGVVEELLFRGLVLLLLVRAWGTTRRGVVGAVVVSALLFGASHLVNLASGDAGTTALQATEAGLSAVLYGALVLTGGSLWPAIALHGVVNVLVNLAAANTAGFDVGPGDYLTFTMLQVPVFVYGVHLLRTRSPATGDGVPVGTGPPGGAANPS